MFYPDYSHKGRGKKARIERLQILVDFLKSMPDDKVHAALADSPYESNLLLLGDWWLAESISPVATKGYLQTIATWHAPTVLRRLETFNVELERLLREAMPQNVSSRLATIRALEKRIRRLRRTSSP